MLGLEPYVVATVVLALPVTAGSLKPDAEVRISSRDKLYHAADCDQLDLSRTVLTLREAEAKGYKAHDACADRITPPVATPEKTGPSGRYKAGDYEVGLTVLTPTPVRAQPEATAPVVGTLKRLSLPPPRIIEAKAGWMHVLVVPAEDSTIPEYDGWIRPPPSPELIGSPLVLGMRLVPIRENRWPRATEDAIAKGQVRIGFTKEQVEIARRTTENFWGKPTAKRTLETASGVAEAWVYPDVVIRLRGDKVVEIEKLELELKE